MDIEQELHRLQAVEKQYHDLLNSRTSLRDQFAMAALPAIIGMIAVWDAKKMSTEELDERCATTSFRIAHAMLAHYPVMAP